MSNNGPSYAEDLWEDDGGSAVDYAEWFAQQSADYQRRIEEARYGA